MRNKTLEALVESTRNDYIQQKRNQQVHFAAVVKRNKILAIAQNYYSISNSSWPRRSMVHAERAVIQGLGDLSKLKGAELFVWRVSRKNEWTLFSRPCSCCSKLLETCARKWGLARITYTM